MVLFLPLFATVTFAAPAAPLQDLAPRLSAQLGMEVTIDRELCDQVVLIHTKDLPRDRFLKGIEDATRAEWTQDGKRLRLARPPKMVAQLWKEDAAARRPEIDSTLKAVASQLAAMRPIDAATVREITEGKGNGFSILTRAGIRTALALGTEAITEVKAGERVVYSNWPVNGQRKMPTSIVSVLKPTLEEAQTYSEYLQNLSGYESPTQQMVRLAKPTRVIHAIISRPRGFFRTRTSGEIAIRFRAYTVDGVSQAEGKYVIVKDPRFTIYVGSHLELQPSAEAHEWARVLEQPEKPLPPRLLESLRDPQRTEPAELALGAVLRQRAQGKSLIACISDVAVVRTLHQLRNRKTLLWQPDTVAIGVAETVDEDLVMLTSKAGVELLDTIPRRALKRLIDGIAPSGHLNIDAVAAYEEVRPGGLQEGDLDHLIVTSLFGDTLQPDSEKGLGVTQAIEARLLAILDLAHRARPSNSSVNSPLLDPGQIAAVRRILFGGPVTSVDQDVPLEGMLSMEPTMAPRLKVAMNVSTESTPGWERVDRRPTIFSTDTKRPPGPIRTGVMRHVSGTLELSTGIPGDIDIVMPLNVHEVMIDRLRR